MESEYTKWETAIKTMKGYNDDLSYFVYPIYVSNDNTLRVDRVKDLQNNITFNVTFKGVTFCNVTDVTIDEDDDINFLSSKLHGMVGFIEKKHWFYG